MMICNFVFALAATTAASVSFADASPFLFFNPKASDANAATSLGTVNVASYPPMDVVPPTNDSWTKKFAHNVPNLPQSGANGLPHPDLGIGKTTCVQPKSFCFTFDDGPSIPTPKLLDELKARNVKVTFFVVGSRVLSRPKILLRAYEEGHQIGIHTWSHPHLTSLTNAQIVAEIAWTAKIIREAIGVTPVYFRPPYGDADARVVAIAKNMGMTVVNWAIASGDSGGQKDVPGVFKKFIAKNPAVSPISLEHDLFDHGAKQAPAAIDAILAAKYSLKTVTQCLGDRMSYSDKMWIGL